MEITTDNAPSGRKQRLSVAAFTSFDIILATNARYLVPRLETWGAQRREYAS